MTERLLILGNSAAALAAVRAYRAHGGEGRITLVSRETCDAYSPVLTTYYLRGQIPEERLFVCDGAFYEEAGVERVLGRSAVNIETLPQEVRLDDGRTLSYDSLLIATGAAPRRLDGLDPDIEKDVLYLRTIDDARSIRERAERAARVVVVGGGLVSLQVAAALARPGRRVTGIVSSRQILSQNIDAQAARIVQGHLEEQAPIDFVFAAGVAAIERAGAGLRLLLDSGEQVDADMVVVGKGVRPNLDFIDREAIAVGRGIRVDERMRTTAQNVYASGDVTEGVNRLTGIPEPVPTWSSACEQGRVAGMNLASVPTDYRGSLPENITTVFGLRVASLGLVRVREGDSGLQELVHREGRVVYRKFVLRDERLVGALLVGEVDDAGVLRDVIAGDGLMGAPADSALRGGLFQADRLRARRSGPRWPTGSPGTRDHRGGEGGETERWRDPVRSLHGGEQGSRR